MLHREEKSPCTCTAKKIEEDKSEISRRQENFDQQRQGNEHTRTRTLTTLTSLDFPHFYKRKLKFNKENVTDTFSLLWNSRGNHNARCERKCCNDFNGWRHILLTGVHLLK